MRHPTRRGAHCAPVALWEIAWWNIRQTLYNFYVRQDELPPYDRPMKGFRPAFFQKGWMVSARVFHKVVTDGSDSVPFIEDHYTLYNVSFDEFSERIHSIFTDNCLTSTDYAIKFKNYNGRVAVHFSLHNEMVAGMTIYVQELRRGA